MKTDKIKAKRYNYFIGIDISKNELDYAVMKGNKLLFHEENINDPDAFMEFIEKLKTLPGFTIAKALFCMEQIGIYSNYILSALRKLKANVVLENPLKIKSFLGMTRGKDDKQDSIRIALYAQKNKDDLHLWEAKRPEMIELKSLAALRNQLLTISVALKTSIKETEPFILGELQDQRVRLMKSSINAVNSDLDQVNTLIDQLISRDEKLQRLMELISSVVGVGRVTGLQVIICTNEFKDINNPKKFACYAGVAPFKNESGITRKRARVSLFANKKMKALLHTCALAAKNADPELSAYYQRKTLIEGKPKFSVLNAIRYKLVLRIFACVNQDRLFIKGHRITENISSG